MSEEHPHIEEVFIPEQVRRGARRAEELQRQLVEGTPSEEPQTQEAPRSEGEPPAQPTAEGAPQAAGEPQQRELPLDDWQQRYRTLQGKYDSEIGHLRGQIQGMERLLATMQTPPAPQPTTVVPAAPAHFNEQDVEVYGQDLLDAIARTAEARYGAQIQNLQNQIQQLQGGQQTITNASHQDRVFRELDQDPELVGRWRNLNTDPRFNEWLQGVDEFSGMPRNTMLQHAYVNGDTQRCGRFFKRFLSEHTVPTSIAVAPQTGIPPAPSFNSGNGQVPAGRPRLEDLAAPGRAASSAPGNGAPSPRIWSRSDIKAFFNDRTAGRYRGREAEAQRLEEDLFAAEREGRIQ